MRHKILIILAVIFGLLAFVLTYTQLENEKKRINGDAEHVILIRMKHDMIEGEEIKEEDVEQFKTRRKKDNQMLSRELQWNELSMIIGRKLATSVAQGQVLLSTDLQQPTERNGFNSRVNPLMRAVAVPVDPVSSVNYLIQPNDHVDVIGTFRFPNMKGNSEMDTVTITILQNVQVLAVGNRWGRSSIEPGSGRNYGTITLQLYPVEVEMLVFASQKGTLTFSLRNYSDHEIDNDVESRKVNFSILTEEIPKYNKRRNKSK